MRLTTTLDLNWTEKKVKLTLIYLSLFAFVGFIGLILIVNAFANRDHRLYIPVLILGIMCFVASIYYGYLGISTLKDGLIGEKPKKE